MDVPSLRDANGSHVFPSTTTMYREDGSQFHVSDFFFELKPCKWFARNGSECIEVGKLYLEARKKDSPGQLADDLESIVNHPNKVVCAYFGRERLDCEGCKFEEIDVPCSYAFLQDIIARIRCFGGDDE